MRKEPENLFRPVRKIRSSFGTRVARRVVCSACGEEDSIPFAPKDVSAAYCRKCAFKLLGVVDLDDAKLSVQQMTCDLCKRLALVPVRRKDTSQNLCSDCLCGIESKQKDRATKGTRLGARVVRVRKNPPNLR